MSRKTFSAAPLAAIALAALTAGCGNIDLNPLSTGAVSVKAGSPSAASGQVTPADTIKVLPLNAEDLDCPSLDIADGGATLRVGGPDNKSVRYQFDLGDLARECVPQGSQFALKIGISGQALVGPAGAPGTFSTDLKILVAGGANKKTLYQKSYKVTVDTKGGARGPFTLVADPILLPLTRTDLDNVYTVTVGFGNSVAVRPKREHS